jgi:hypothetical protein
MSLEFVNIPMPKSARTVESKYKFDQLTVGGMPLVETEVLNVEKAKSKLTSALVAYRGRTADRSKFSIRAVKNADGTDAVGCWKIADAPSA